MKAVRALCIALALEGRERARAGDAAGAVRSLLDAARLAQDLARGGPMLAQAFAIGWTTSIGREIEGPLGRGRLDGPTLRALAGEIGRLEAGTPPLAEAWRTERLALDHWVLSTVERGESAADALAGLDVLARHFPAYATASEQPFDEAMATLERVAAERRGDRSIVRSFFPDPRDLEAASREALARLRLARAAALARAGPGDPLAIEDPFTGRPLGHRLDEKSGTGFVWSVGPRGPREGPGDTPNEGALAFPYVPLGG